MREFIQGQNTGKWQNQHLHSGPFYIRFYEELHFMILLCNKNKNENAKEWVLSASQLLRKTNLYNIKIRQMHFILSAGIAVGNI